MACNYEPWNRVTLILNSTNSHMNIMLGLFNLGGGEIILILAIILILFGAKKLPELAKGLGQGIREFKKATQNASEGLREAMAESSSTTPRPSPTTTASVDPESIVSNTPAGPIAIRAVNSLTSNRKLK